MENLVEITEKEFGVILDLRYASANNVCGHKLYSKPLCFLHKDAANALKKAVFFAANLNLKIKIFDGFRPIEVQKYMYDKFPSNDPNGGFVSNPENGAIPHCRGIAIDLTLVDASEKELDMGTDFDEFSDLAFHNCTKISHQAKQNRLILAGIMALSGFDFYSKEWWHYQLFKPREYSVVKTPDNFLAI